ncbi:metallophosphoesterase [Pediococcus argentinicus]|uniref:metallophosphoesterase n=1 Tax=Pediococcus argentinicus TaxID=480391 RepID=UPI00070970E1|nr:metallophosphoesterase [Pediococcus argentinicus]NKZ22974.1 metallophosphatase [Pediococcus argentinicus]GEP20033.1 metallophosphatase [Pediococcus argentinicus]
MKFFVSDTHFFHKDLLGMNDFAPRPFNSVEEMNQEIIKNWNDRVGENDTVYHLGDIALYFIRPERASNEAVFQVLKELHGHLVLIKGNHDSRSLFKYLSAHNYEWGGKSKFEFHDVGKLIKLNHRQLIMSHYPISLGIVNQIINLHGHIHHYSVNARENINVGIDTPEKDYLDYKIPFGAPFSERDIERMIDQKKIDFAKRR